MIVDQNGAPPTMFVPARRRRPATWALYDYNSASEYYAHAVPMSRWPRPHASDHVFARLKLFVYRLPINFSRMVFEMFTMHMKNAYVANLSSSCLVRPCHLLGWGGSAAQMRTFSSEVPVLMRLLQSCTLVESAADADAYLVPFPMGLWQISGWIFRRPPQVSGLLAALPSLLVHLNERTASRHIFLNSVDSCYVAVGTTVPLAHRAIVLHLGDDMWNGSSAKGLYHKTRLNHRGTRFNRSLVVPYRAPLPLEASNEPAAVWGARRPVLLFGALGVHRHPKRGVLVRTVMRAAAADPRAAGRVHLLSNVSTLAEASSWARRSTFCLCPSGDNPAFTQRFYFSLLRGCIPVRVDLYRRAPADASGPAFPFPSLINWSRAVVDVGTADGPPGSSHAWAEGVLPLLLGIEPRAPQMRAYIESIAHWLAFDAHGPDGVLREQDAASATIFQLAELLGVDLGVAKAYL